MWHPVEVLAAGLLAHTLLDQTTIWDVLPGGSGRTRGMTGPAREGPVSPID